MAVLCCNWSFKNRWVSGKWQLLRNFEISIRIINPSGDASGYSRQDRSTSWLLKPWRLKPPASRLLTQPFIQEKINENIKAPRHCPVYGAFDLGWRCLFPEATFTLCQPPCPSPCPYQSPCPNNNHFLMKLEAVFRLHQFPCQSPIQCHQISVRSVSIGPPTVKNWYGRPFPSESCKSLYKITLWRLARQLWT